MERLQTNDQCEKTNARKTLRNTDQGEQLDKLVC